MKLIDLKSEGDLAASFFGMRVKVKLILEKSRLKS